MKLTTRSLFTFLLVLSLMGLAGAFILQYGFHQEPCALCIIDRILVILLAVIYLIALWHRPQKRGERVYSMIGFIIALLGILVTSRHLWIMHLPPDQMPSCTAGFRYLLESMPFHEAFMTTLQSGECGKHNPIIFGVSTPAWTLLYFIILAAGNILGIKKGQP